MKRIHASLIALIATAVIAAAGCDEHPAPSDAATPGRATARDVGRASSELLILAAASTSDAMTEVAARFRQETGIAVKVTTGGSNALANQILAGVPGDVFLSANPKWAEAVREAGLAIAVEPLLTNRLVLVVPRGNPASVARPEDLRSEKVRHVALAGESVPAGIYAEQALRQASVYTALTKERRIARGQDVRLTLGYVETGEAEAGVVYATDADASDDVEVVYAFPSQSHEPIVYPVVLLKTARDSRAARRFHDFLRSAPALNAFERRGFAPVHATEAR